MRGALLAEFSGPVQCRREIEPAALVLAGAERSGGAPLELRFMAPGPDALPAIVSDIDVYAIEPGEWKLRAYGGSWSIRARTLLAHRDVSAAFFAALPPPRVSWTARFGWSLLLAIARIPAAVRLLGWLRSR
ncbi:MAG: hypothetical protein IT480_07725 [Gammaproteobacteria bacterium]|nr:hypothetical protein [Gammaproteobacteria bacterium]